MTLLDSAVRVVATVALGMMTGTLLSHANRDFPTGWPALKRIIWCQAVVVLLAIWRVF